MTIHTASGPVRVAEQGMRLMGLSQRITTLTGGGSDGWDVLLKARRMIADGTQVTE